MVRAERAPKQLASGDVIAGKFVVEKTIGVGGMGQVVSARHHELGTRVAIKVVHVDQLSESDSVARFKREARAMAKLTSEHAVRVYDVGETDSGLPFMIMEYLEGRDLGSLLMEKGPLPLDDVLSYMIQATEALIEAHEVGIIHRDLKPQNLFVSKRGNGVHLRVLDFGLAKPLKMIREESKKLTRPGDIIGTSHYMAPEQIRGQELDPRTDVWGAGACMYRLLTRAFPFPGESAPMVCACILTDPPTPLRSIRAEIPPVLEAVVNRCLEKRPEDRYQSMRELALVLRGVQNGSAVARPRFGAPVPDEVTVVDATPPTRAAPTNVATTLPHPVAPVAMSQAPLGQRVPDEHMRTLVVPTSPLVNAPAPPSVRTQISAQLPPHAGSGRYDQTRISAGHIGVTPQPPGSYAPVHPQNPASGRISLTPVQQELSGTLPAARFPGSLAPEETPPHKRVIAGVVLGLIWAAVVVVVILVVMFRRHAAQPTPEEGTSAQEPPSAVATPPPSIITTPAVPTESTPTGEPSGTLDPASPPTPVASAPTTPTPRRTTSRPGPSPPTTNAATGASPPPPPPPPPAPHKPNPASSSHYDHL